MDDTIAGVILLSKKYFRDVIVFDDRSVDDTKTISKMAGAKFVGSGTGIDFVDYVTKSFTYAKRKNADFLILLPGHFPFKGSMVGKISDEIKRDKNDVILTKSCLDENITHGFTVATILNKKNRVPTIQCYSKKAIRNVFIIKEGENYMLKFDNDLEKSIKIKKLLL